MNRDADPDVITAIEMTNLCEALHVLPTAGGLLDQDSYHVYLLQATLVAKAEKAELDRKQGKG